jgi:hypothetical protein
VSRATRAARTVFVGTVRGQVTERANGGPIAGAQLSIAGTILRAVTDVQGRYTITRVPAGQRTISVRGLVASLTLDLRISLWKIASMIDRKGTGFPQPSA